MTKSSTASPFEVVSAPAGVAATVDALHTLGAMIRIQAAYQHLVKSRVFAATTLTDRKAALRYEKTLLAQASASVLMVIWKDSPTVTQQDLNGAGLERLGSACEPLTCHGLATRLAVDGKDFEKQQKRVQAIVAAGEAYGLVVRDAHATSNRRILRGTQQLHDLMLALSALIRPICADAAAETGVRDDG